MDARGNEADLSELFAHQEWVRALALRLCGDHATADDLVQDTLIEALRGRSQANSVRAWLGGIVRHRWRRDRLRSNARVEREASVAHSARAHAGEMPSPEGMFAQAELQRRVLAAVASLEEAARTVVLLRYYEGLSSEAIAARLGEPASTVRNRLARAHEKLRGKLDQEYGGVRGEWAVLFVPFAGSHAGSLSTGIGIAMKTKLLVTVTILAAGSALLWFTMKPDANATATTASTLLPPSTGHTATIEAPAVAATTSVATRSPVPESATLAAEPLLLWGEVHGPTPAQVTDASLWIFAEDGARRVISAGANATYSAFGLQPGTIQLSVVVRGFVPQEDEIVLAPGSGQTRHDVTLTPAFVVPVKFVDRSTGQPLKPIDDIRGTGLAATATRARPQHIENVMGRFPLSADAGDYRAKERFGSQSDITAGYDGVLEIHPPLPVYASCVLHDTVIDSRLVHGNEQEIVFEIDPAELSVLFARVELRCVDITGAPVEGASISLGPQDVGGSSVKSDAQGHFAFERLSPGLQLLNIRSKGCGTYQRVVRVAPRSTTDLGTIELRPAASIQGRILNSSGAPLDGSVSALPARQAASASSVSMSSPRQCQPGGKFEVASIERGPCRLVAEAKGFASKIIDMDTSGGDITGLEVRLEPGTLVRFKAPKSSSVLLYFVVADAAGVPIRSGSTNHFFAREMTLAPGHYRCWTMLDERIAHDEEFDVGNTTLVHEVEVP